MYFASQTGAFSPHRGKCGASLPVLSLELTSIFHMRWDFSRSVCEGDWMAACGRLSSDTFAFLFILMRDPEISSAVVVQTAPETNTRTCVSYDPIRQLLRGINV